MRAAWSKLSSTSPSGSNSQKISYLLCCCCVFTRHFAFMCLFYLRLSEVSPDNTCRFVRIAQRYIFLIIIAQQIAPLCGVSH